MLQRRLGVIDMDGFLMFAFGVLLGVVVGGFIFAFMAVYSERRSVERGFISIGDSMYKLTKIEP